MVAVRGLGRYVVRSITSHVGYTANGGKTDLAGIAAQRRSRSNTVQHVDIPRPSSEETDLKRR